MWDTFWVDDKRLLRTHTSRQVRRCASANRSDPRHFAGKCYRYEQITARSEHQFYQVEGWRWDIYSHDRIDRNADGVHPNVLRGGSRTRVRGHTSLSREPSIEVDMDCILCGGIGLPVCKYTVGWRSAALGWFIRWCCERRLRSASGAACLWRRVVRPGMMKTAFRISGGSGERPAVPAQF